MKIKYLLIPLVILTVELGATIQGSDPIEIEGETVFVKGIRLSDELNQRIENTKQEMGGRIVSVSSNWDGFYTEMEMRDEKLYLTNLSIDWYENNEYTKKSIELPNEGVWCDWFTGELRDETWKDYSKIVKITVYYIEDGILIGKKTKRKPFWKDSL